jgi:hypothetical protein
LRFPETVRQTKLEQRKVRIFATFHRLGIVLREEDWLHSDGRKSTPVVQVIGHNVLLLGDRVYFNDANDPNVDVLPAYQNLRPQVSGQLLQMRF